MWYFPEHCLITPKAVTLPFGNSYFEASWTIPTCFHVKSKYSRNIFHEHKCSISEYKHYHKYFRRLALCNRRAEIFIYFHSFSQTVFIRINLTVNQYDIFLRDLELSVIINSIKVTLISNQTHAFFSSFKIIAY